MKADGALAELASAHGVATSYTDWRGRPAQVEVQTVVDVLAALEVDASSPAAVAAALRAVHGRPAGTLPPTVVATAGRPLALPVTAPVRLRPESGPELELPEPELPGDLPVGWYDLRAGDASATVMVVPERLELPVGMHRAWGWMLQLYQLRSAGSWAMGDYADLADVIAWSSSAAGGGAGLVLCNPLHAMTPVLPVQDSPYFPSSRRFRSPLYLRITDLPEYAVADPAVRRRVDRLRPAAGERIDRDAVWSAKEAALRLLWPYARQEELSTFRRRHGPALEDFAVFCLLAQLHGADWRQWPAELRDPRGEPVRAACQQHADRVAFHAWLQLLCDEQLAAAAAAGALAVGVIHDLAVGVDPGGADAWAMQGLLARGATVGCPPDAFNQQGQDWGLPPWQPARLASAGYEPFRDLVRAVLRHAGGIRVDHVMGLFRLWWVPAGNRPDRGAYVAYDAEAMLGTLLVEAHLAGAVVVGEDLGTVEPRVRRRLAAADVLGSDVAWFERTQDGAPRRPATWRSAALASVTTHDLPTVAGWLSDEALRVRADLGLLDGPPEEEQERAAAERAALLGLLRAERLLAAGPVDPAEIMLALHRLLVASPAALVVGSLGDAVGDLRQPNLPGTVDAYPNWRLPLADRRGRPVPLEQLRRDPRVHQLAQVLAAVGSAPAEPAAQARSDSLSRVIDPINHRRRR